MPEFISILRYIRDVLYPDIVRKHNIVQDVKLNEDNINNVSDNMQSVITVANNETQIQEISNKIVPVINEVLEADTNAQIATTKASEAETHAESALTASGISYKWANELEDVIVYDGKYSAFHWAMKASTIVGDGVIDDSLESLATTYSSSKLSTLFAEKLNKNNPHSTGHMEIEGTTNSNYLTMGGDGTGANNRGLSYTSSAIDGLDGAEHTINAKSTSGKISLATNGVKYVSLDKNGLLTLPSSTTIGIVTANEIARLSGLTSNAQEQLDNKTDKDTQDSINIEVSNSLANKLNYDANAISASKWNIARTITLTGAITGSVSIDGSANVIVNTSLNMDILDYVNARDYFIIGEADDSGSLRRALNTGKNVKIDGTFYISTASGSYNIGNGFVGQILFGANPRADKIVITNNDSSNLFQILSDYSSYWGLGIEMASGMKVGGSYVALIAGTRGNVIDKFRFQHCFKGISIDAEAVVTIIGNGEILDATSVTGVGIYINGGNDTFIGKVVMDSGGVEPLAGIRIKRTQAIFASDVDIIDFGTPLLIDPSNSITDLVTWCFFNSLACDTSTGNGIKIHPTGGVTVKGLFFDNCWSATNSLCGAYINATGGAVVDGVYFTDSSLVQNTNEGLYAEGNVHNVEVNGTKVTGNGGGTKAGITFNRVSDFSITSCRSGAAMGMPVSQTYGINIIGDVNNYIIANNNLTGNITDGMYISNISAGTNASIMGNIGTAIGNYKNGNKIWDAGNDGSGSGLDADLLDGLNSSEFMRKSDSNTITQNILFNNGTADSNGFGFVSNTGATPSQDINVDIYNGKLRLFRNNGVTPLSIDTDNNLYSDNGTNGNGRVLTSTTPLGYSTIGVGVGGVVTQGSLKTDVVTLNKLTGKITMSSAALASGASSYFQHNNTMIDNGDVVYPSITSGTANSNNYRLECIGVVYGQAYYRLTNLSGGTLSEPVAFNYVVIKGKYS